MAPSRSSAINPRSLSEVAGYLTSTVGTTRAQALDKLNFFLDPSKHGSSQSAANAMGDKEWHSLCEALFRCTLNEKEAYFANRKKSTSDFRLRKCAEALRNIVMFGASQLKRKTARAIIDHISEVLPGPNERFFEPLLQNYLKAWTSLLGTPSVVENLAALRGDGWEVCVDFCVETLSQYLVAEGTASGRASSALGSAQTGHTLGLSSGRCSSFATQQKAGGQIGNTVAGDMMTCLDYLFAASNAPFQGRAKSVSRVVIQVLQVRQNLTALQRLGFSVLNHLFLHIRVGDVVLANSIARDLIPLCTHWWQSRTSSRDALLNSFRDEIMKAIFGVHLHVESLVQHSSDANLLQQLEDLMDALWTEYSRRDERARLQLDDLTFTSMCLPPDHPRTAMFSLRPYHPSAEQNWALIENLALLESIFAQRPSVSQVASTREDEQARKKRKVEWHFNRIHQKLTSLDSGIRLTALQVIPFLPQQWALRSEDISETFDALAGPVVSKQGFLASWAMLAYCSLASSPVCRGRLLLHFWKQTWQIGVRSVSLPGTCRAASVLLHSILKSGLVQTHEIADDVNQIVTTADISGPAILADSSLVLMSDLLRVRNVMFPNASQATSNHIIRWLFVKWNPAELAYASLHSKHALPFDLANLLRACSGMPGLRVTAPIRLYGGPISQFWKCHKGAEIMTRYALLLDDMVLDLSATASTGNSLEESRQVPDPSVMHAAKRLILELFHAKIEELVQVVEPWQKRGGDNAAPISSDRLQSLVAACLLGVLLLPELSQLNIAASREMGEGLFSLIDAVLGIVLDSGQGEVYSDLLLIAVAPHLPAFREAEMAFLSGNNKPLLQFFVKLSTALQEKTRRENASLSPEKMDLDDEDDFDTQTSQQSSSSKPQGLPRRDIWLSHTFEAFALETRLGLLFLGMIYQEEDQVGLVPHAVVTELLALSNDQLLCCRCLMMELFSSGLLTASEDAFQIFKAAASILGEAEYYCCEAALCACIDLMDSFISMWTHESNANSEVGDVYYHLVNHALPKDFLSPTAQLRLAVLLFHVMEINPTYAEGLDLPSCRTSLLTIVRDGRVDVKYAVGRILPKVFGLYVLKTHDDIFVDMLESLPSDAGNAEGITCRLFVLAELSCAWSTLLRRCIYHTFETAGKVSSSTKHAASCLKRVAHFRQLETPRQLFQLFAPQLLYTWLEDNSIASIPFEIFGYPTLKSLLSEAKDEAAAIMIMRGQEQELQDLARALGLGPLELIGQCFPKIAAYSIAHDQAASKLTEVYPGEIRLKEWMGKKPFFEGIHANFVDILGTFFETFDQEDPIEKTLRRDEKFAYAGQVMEDIKRCGCLNAELPPNQQPAFRGKHLPKQIEHLVRQTPHDLSTLWTPPLVVAVARRLLNTMHPFLGPLHACSVLRKIRVLICFAGSCACSSYPVEVLLHSMRSFIMDVECADDAFGISQYLLDKGSGHLRQTPSFLAGYALSTLADLRVFLESSQTSTTRESQFKATMSKAKRFHTWLSKYLEAYKSPLFRNKANLEQAFRAITTSATQIRASGNAEKGTHESRLLLEILRDRNGDNHLLNEPARVVALSMLCGVFKVPASSRIDVIETDADALDLGPAIWNSCSSLKLSDEYLAWAGRVIGRAFAASGEVPGYLLRESRLDEYRKQAKDNWGSEEGLLGLMEALTVSSDHYTAGLAESALRTVYTEAKAVAENQPDLLSACQKSLSEPLYLSSDWEALVPPPSDCTETLPVVAKVVFAADRIEKQDWAQQLSVYLAQSVPDMVTLRVLPPILTKVKGFAEKAFPFILHLVLDFQVDKKQGVKSQLSEALEEWFGATSVEARENLKLMIHTVLYLRTRAIPNEVSISDRTHWLDMSFSTAATAAARCGMYKVSLLFVELASSEMMRTSRRSSALPDMALKTSSEAGDMLLDIFANIDDPDAYYGLRQEASLATVLARLEYENDGTKSLAFRGAQYDSNLRRRDAASSQDSQALVKALSGLGLSGLSNSLLQTQQSADGSNAWLDSMYTTARRLEIWNLPAPSTHDSYAVTVYKAFQSLQKASDISAVRASIYDGLSSTVLRLSAGNLNTAALRHRLGALAALTELDDLLNVAGRGDLVKTWQKLQDRSKWMMSGRYLDVSQILSCRGTSLSVLSQHNRLRAPALTPDDARLVQIQGLLLASDIYRVHRATQETLNISTALTHLIQPSEHEGLVVDAAVRMETAQSLWDHGEMLPSIRMLQGIDTASLAKQSVPVSLSNLLSKIGHQVSMARLEGPDSIQKNYLEPALKELKGKMVGKEAGRVFHQFAMFCDEQLQNADGLEDLVRLQNLRKGKSEEVAQLNALMATVRESQQKARYSSALAKAKQWLDLDESELRRVESTRAEFVRLSLENYLLSLAASDEHNNDALRFTALWLERAEDPTTAGAVKKQLEAVPTRKFAPLMNQLTSRLQEYPGQSNEFQNLLINLVFHICADHPYHGMYQIWSSAKSRLNKDDEVAVYRHQAAAKIAKALAKNGAKTGEIWPRIDQTSRAYHALAIEKDPNKYKAGQKVAIKDSKAGLDFLKQLERHPIPPPTIQLELRPDMDYSGVSVIAKFEPHMSIASGVSAPKILTAVGSDGRRYKQLVKGGNDDLRQDAIMEQVFAAVSELLKLHRTTRQRNLGIRTYKVLPLTSQSGLIEFVSDTIPLHEYLMPAHQRYYPKDLGLNQCRKEISNAQGKSIDARLAAYRRVTDKFHPVLRYFFLENFPDPDEWFTRRTAYTRTTAAVSMLGHVLGLGDRHGHNILLDSRTGEVVHIDLGVAFEMGRVLPVPELVPFRLTRDIVDGMGITRTEGVFRRCCEFTLDALREETYSIMTVLDVLRYDPLYSWSISPVRLAKLQNAARGSGPEEAEGGALAADGTSVNEPSEADRALEVVRKKLSKTLSVTATVNDLINQATDERNLAVLYSGWAAYA